MKALLDTTVLIDILKGDELAIAAVEKLRSGGMLFTSAINIYEITRGICVLGKDKEKHMQALRILMGSIDVLDLDAASAENAASLYALLRKKGIEIDEPDYLIAGICLANGVSTIVTRNEKHFRAIEGISVLSY